MAFRRPSPKDIRFLCDAVGPDDGIDPRFLRQPDEPPSPRKALQLCRQVHEALAGALSSCGDESLRDLSVLAVAPAGGGRLLVTLRQSDGDPAALGSALHRARGLLRSEVAAAVHRRLAPDLVFQVLVTG